MNKLEQAEQENARLRQRILELTNSTSTTTALAKQVDNLETENARLREERDLYKKTLRRVATSGNWSSTELQEIIGDI